jgi:hypothetical protein
VTRAPVALAGVAFGLFAASLAHALPAFFWPLAGLALLRGALVAGGVAALAAGLAPVAWREWLRGHRGLLASVAAAAAATVIGTTGALAHRLRPEAGLGLPDFPLLYLAALAVPFIAVGVGLVTWCEPAERGSRAWFLTGIGAGVLGVSLLAGIQGAASPWLGGRFVEVSDGRISVDRGLREFPASPEAADLAFPPADGAETEVLMVGIGSGSVLARLVGEPQVRVTILGEDGGLAPSVLERWPAFERARAEGRLTIAAGAERWALAGLGRRFDLVVLCESWSGAAYRSRTLSHRRDYRWTSEAFAEALARLKPGGRLLVQRNGIARVLLTLREASGLTADEFARRVVVLGQGGGNVSECWYGSAGFESRELRAVLRRHRRSTRPRVVYSPLDVLPGGNFYQRLVKGDRPRGLAFSTSLDLSPPIDERPFFDHVERLMLSLRLRGMQEELEPRAGAQELRVFLAADRPLWGILVGGLLFGTGVVALARRGAGSPGASTMPSAGAAVDALWRGAAGGLVIECFAVWAGWLAPSSLAAAAGLAALLAGLGVGWGGMPRSAPRWTDWAPAAALALLLGAAGYRVLPAAVRVGPALTSAAMIAVGALLGTALGRAAGATPRATAAPAAGTEASGCGVVLAAAGLATVAASLAATHFGYPLLWVLGALSLVAPALRRRSEAPFAPDRAT